jgi:uncharacterized membrane protein YphA (DoxX/SURF4 family)
MKRKFAIITLVTACALLFTLFAYASYEKLKIYPTFVQQLKASPVTSGYENILSWLVPSIEISLCLLLLFNRTRLTGLWGSFFLMLLFTVYVFVVPHFFKQHTCNCGGIISKLSWRGHFYMNLCFTLLAGAAVSLFPFTRKQLA